VPAELTQTIYVAALRGDAGRHPCRQHLPVPQPSSPDPTPRSTRIQEEMRFKVLRALEQQPDLSQRQLADMLGVSLGKANYLLRALLDKGLLKARNFRNSQNKLAYAYLITPGGLAEKAALTRGYLERKSQEYEALRDEIDKLKLELEQLR
jgi:EPS-associated MarR family transcriptional regulator